MSNVVTIDFYGNSIVAVLKEGVPYVAMKPICENIGLQWEAQHKRMQRSPALAATMSVMDIVAEDGKLREMVCLPLDMLNGWLFGVDVNRVKPELKEKLVRYQKECYGVLFKHFFKPEHTTPVTPVAELTAAERGVRIVRADLEVAALFGTPVHIAQTEAVKDALRLTGHDFTPLLLAAPAQSQIREQEEMLEPTDLAERLGLGSRGAAVNSLLERAGFQYKDSAGRWNATSVGLPYCSRHHWSKGGKSGYNYKWNVAEVRMLLDAEEASQANG